MNRSACVGQRMAVAMIVVLAVGVAHAEAPRFYDLEGFGHFLDGDPQTTAVSEDGAVTLPPPSSERFVDAAATFTAAVGRGEDVIVARADNGEVLSIDKAGKTTVLFKSQDAVVTALLVDGNDLFVATGAPGKIYRVSGGKQEVYFTSEAQFIWGMVKGPKGGIFAVTGSPGTVVRVDKKDSAKVLFKPEQEHLRSIAVSESLGVFVGGGERGVVYRAADLSTFRALYDTANPEVTSLVVYDKYVFAAGVTGSAEITADNGDEGKGKGKGKPANVRSQLVRIAMDGSNEVLAGSSDEAIFAMAMREGELLIATGATGKDAPKGRLYKVEPITRQISLLLQSASRRLTHLLPLGKSMALVAAGGGRVTILGAGFASKGIFLTETFDTGINSQWGALTLMGRFSKGKVTAAVRTGQTAEPDDSWSAWSKETAATDIERPEGVVNGRYLQIRLTLEGDGKSTPAVHRVRLAYMRQNVAPYVREVVALKKGLGMVAMPSEAIKGKTISLNDKGSGSDRGEDDERPAPSGRARQVDDPGALTVRWAAEDPNGDELRYELSYRRQGQDAWRVLKGDLDQPFHTIRATQLADGWYQFRVKATDAPSNAEGSDKSDTRESRDVLVDNTPPEIVDLDSDVSGKKATLEFTARDAVGPLVGAMISLDARNPKPIVPVDGVLDGPEDKFRVSLGELSSGEHVVVVRVRDDADNEMVRQLTFSVP